MQPHFEFELPAWVQTFLAQRPAVYTTAEDRVRLAIELAKENVIHKTGGPFGSAIFDSDGRLIAPGINLVTSQNCSVLHAEMVAIMLAQQTLGRYDLSDGGKHHYEIVASSEPCAMCSGAIPWSGVKRLACGNRDEDVRAIGFDEGAKVNDWAAALEERGISVTRDVLRDEANAVFDLYQQDGGTIY